MIHPVQSELFCQHQRVMTESLGLPGKSVKLVFVINTP
jgi:hypothetical protein